MASKPARRVRNPPPAWQKAHTQSAKRLLQTEAKSTVRMRTAIRQVHAELLANMGTTKLEALTALKQARKDMARVVSDQINSVRMHAKDAALEQSQKELQLLTKELRQQGYKVPNLQHRLGVGGKLTAEDFATADAVGNSFAARWSQSVLHHVVNAPAEATNVAARAKLAAQVMDHQVKRIATTETAKAYNDQHGEALDDALEATPSDEALGVEGGEELAIDDEGEALGPWRRDVFKYWNAMLDARVCRSCEIHDGEVVPLGNDFSDGDVPGFMHPSCRCVQSIVYL